jgi:hypothetical protein
MLSLVIALNAHFIFELTTELTSNMKLAKNQLCRSGLATNTVMHTASDNGRPGLYKTSGINALLSQTMFAVQVARNIVAVETHTNAERQCTLTSYRDE